jgi:hypothetical protein
VIKFGGLALSPFETPGGDVAYWFDPASNWSAEEQSGWLSRLALWSVVANIEFTSAADAGARPDRRDACVQPRRRRLH